jgi:hypothetical protein
MLEDFRDFLEVFLGHDPVLSNVGMDSVAQSARALGTITGALWALSKTPPEH